MLETLPDYPAFKLIANALWHTSDVRGAAVMIGSGFTQNATLTSPGSPPPLWGDLVAAMEQRLAITDPGPRNFLRLAEEYRALLGQSALDALIRDCVPDTRWAPGTAHVRLLELPWSDVLTTNWDTLLERAAAEQVDRSYEPVLTVQDIARTRSPRIVKLHGSLPSHTPFIVAEEDFRTYPVKFAPFVNLAQHVLLENELLLVGFSGDDPNFLAWAGWVRDQLGESARKIFLAGVLNLSPSRRRYLEHINVTPIDLSPLVEDVAEPKRKHLLATQILLDGLHAAKPKPISAWARSALARDEKWKQKPAEERLAELIEQWEKERQSAPAWIIPPYFERYHLRMETDDAASLVLADIGSASPKVRGRFAAELAWRLEASLAGVPDWLRAALEIILSKPDAHLAAEERARIVRLLAYQAIEDRDFTRVGTLLPALEAIDDDDEAPAWAAYLKGLEARERLDLAGIKQAVPKIKGSDPAWMLRRAALMFTIDENRAGARLVRDAQREIRRRRRVERRSLWLVSREAWTQFVKSHVRFELREEEMPEEHEDWPPLYGEHKTDPWDEFNTIESEVRREEERGRRYAPADRVHFDAGSWTPRSEESHYAVSRWVVPGELDLRRLADFVGLPRNAGSALVIGYRLARAVSVRAPSTDAGPVWRVATYLRAHDDELMEGWFSRMQVAAMSPELVAELTDGARAALEYLVPTLGQEDDDWIHRVSHARALVELLSRLAVRATSETARDLFEFAQKIFDRGADRHWWLYRPVANLLRRSLSAIPPSLRGDELQGLINFPLPAERSGGGLEEDWPDFTRSFELDAIFCQRQPGAWDARISELIAWTRRDEHLTRRHATLRMRLLHSKGLLSASETRAFASALWSRRTSDKGLPVVEWLIPAVFLELPEPTKGMARRAFDHEVVQPLLGKAPLQSGMLTSLAFAGSTAAQGKIAWPYSAAAATGLLRALPVPTNPDAEAEVAAAIFYGLLPIATMTDAEAADLRMRAEGPRARGALLFLPALARQDPDYAPAAIAILCRALNSRDYRTIDFALSAVKSWATGEQGAAFPAALARAVAGMIGGRRDPGLYRALDVAIELSEAGHIDPDQLTQIVDSLAALLAETDYALWRPGDPSTATFTFIRANAVRLAAALREQGHDHPAIEGWLEAGRTDVMPEVRFAIDSED